VLTIKCVTLETDKTKKTKDHFNTAYFVENEIRPGEQLKPMILNATNSRTMRNLANSAFIDDWNNVSVTVYVDPNVKNRGEIVEGLRISAEKPNVRQTLLKGTKLWDNAIIAYKRDGNLDKVKARIDIPESLEAELIAEATA